MCVGYQAGAWGRFYNHPTRNPHDEGESLCPFPVLSLSRAGHIAYNQLPFMTPLMTPNMVLSNEFC